MLPVKELTDCNCCYFGFSNAAAQNPAVQSSAEPPALVRFSLRQRHFPDCFSLLTFVPCLLPASATLSSCDAARTASGSASLPRRGKAADQGRRNPQLRKEPRAALCCSLTREQSSMPAQHYTGSQQALPVCGHSPACSHLLFFTFTYSCIHVMLNNTTKNTDL